MARAAVQEGLGSRYHHGDIGGTFQLAYSSLCTPQLLEAYSYRLNVNSKEAVATRREITTRKVIHEAIPQTVAPIPEIINMNIVMVIRS